ncbi:29367_t:CDS:2, partial [Gigaspora margarita]
DKGGNPELIKESQRKRGASVELVDEVIKLYDEWRTVRFDLDQVKKQQNALQKKIGQKIKDKEDASALIEEKESLNSEKERLTNLEKEKEDILKSKASMIGNLVHNSVPESLDEVNNEIIRKWEPSTNENGLDIKSIKKDGILSHHEEQILPVIVVIFLPMMEREYMAKTAQLEQFDEELYKVVGDGDDKYLIATSEQPISAFHANEWFEKPAEQLPVKYAGYSTCFRKEAGAHGKDTWGIFRVHQFEKVEQFVISDPEQSWEQFDEMVNYSEEFYQSLNLPYQIVSIVSGALNNAAAKKYDLEAWFPFQGEYKELVSCSNCTDYQSRRLEIRCGMKKMGDREKKYVHCLNATLCATERALCCILENYQTPEGVIIPEKLRPYMDGRDFLPFVKPLPKKK